MADRRFSYTSLASPQQMREINSSLIRPQPTVDSQPALIRDNQIFSTCLLKSKSTSAYLNFNKMYISKTLIITINNIIVKKVTGQLSFKSLKKKKQSETLGKAK